LGVGLLVSSKSRILGAFAAALLSVGSIAVPARARRQTAGQPHGVRRIGMDRFASMLANSEKGSAMSKISKTLRHSAAAAVLVAALGSTAAIADPLGFAAPSNPFGTIFEQVLRDRGTSDDNSGYAARPDLRRQSVARPGQEDTGDAVDLPANLRRHIVEYPTREAAGTIVIDTPHTYLYYVLGGGRAIRYGIGVGREGFTWSGVQTIARKAEWPDWNPPPEMIARQPYLPRFMAGGPSNPLGARAMYLGNTIYRIHGTNAPQTIGSRVSSGCIRLVNADVMDLFSRVNVGTKVVVLPMSGGRSSDRIVQSHAPGSGAPSRIN
jgi:lipoprotein-anchoring transpeptidase ErfK/SrfK